MTKLLLALMAVLSPTFQQHDSSAPEIQTVAATRPQYSILERQSNSPVTKTAPRVAQLQVEAKLSSSQSTRRRQAPNSQRVEAIEFELTGADLIHQGELQTCKIRLTNHRIHNWIPAEIRLGIPPGFVFEDSNIQANFDSKQKIASWRINRISPGQTLEIYFRVRAKGQGPQLHQIQLFTQDNLIASSQCESFVLNPKSSVVTPAPQLEGLPPIVPSEMIRGLRLLERDRTATPNKSRLPYQRR